MRNAKRGDGLKRTGRSPITSGYPGYLALSGAGPWASACQGDSGGPAYLPPNLAGRAVAAVASGGTCPFGPDGFSLYAPLDDPINRDWLRAMKAKYP